jgi:hypothetical protein
LVNLLDAMPVAESDVVDFGRRQALEGNTVEPPHILVFIFLGGLKSLNTAMGEDDRREICGEILMIENGANPDGAIGRIMAPEERRAQEKQPHYRE